jgi:hypothetical protein
LYYTSYGERGGTPDEVCNNSFEITLKSVYNDSKIYDFEFIRCYAIQRTSLEATPTVRIVQDIPIRNTGQISVTIFDNGITGSTVDPNLLLFIGGEELHAGTLVHKDNVLFAGNLDTNDINIRLRDLQNKIINDTTNKYKNFSASYKSYEVLDNTIYGYKPETLNMSSNDIKTWRFGETYRLGIIAKHGNGKVSTPIFLGDYKVNLSYKTHEIVDEDATNPNKIHLGTQVDAVKLMYKMPLDMIDELLSLGYESVIPVFVDITNNRTVLTQGFITPTLAAPNRGTNSPFSYVDYVSRPNREFCFGATEYRGLSDNELIERLSNPSNLYSFFYKGIPTIGIGVLSANSGMNLTPMVSTHMTPTT